MSAAPRWSRVRERGSLLGLRITVACYRAFGRPLTLVLVHLIVTYFFLTDRSGRKASLDYLRRIQAVPEGAPALGRRAGTWASFLHYRAFALSIFDRLALWMGTEGAITFDFPGREPLDRLLASGRGVIILGAHLGSFDALRALAVRDKRVVNVLMYTRHAPRINSIFRELSPDVDVRVLDVSAGPGATALEIRERINRGELVAMLGDRVEPTDRSRTCLAPLLGGSVQLPQAPYLMAGLLGCPLVVMVALRTGAGRYRVFADVLSERVELPREERVKRVRELAAAYTARLEHYCLRAPYQWFNFFDLWEGRAG